MSEFIISLNDEKISIAYSGNSRITVDKNEYECDLIHLEGQNYILKLNNNFYEVTSNKLDNDRFSVLINGCHFELEVRSLLQEKARELLQKKSSAHQKTEVKAPMPGMILKIKKNVSESIMQGETVLILEAMKMENDLRAPRPGIIKEILVEEGTAVEKGAVLFTIK